jgi:hypothetical protein
MNRCDRFLTALFLLLACCGRGEAQTFYGASGLFVHPTAFVGRPQSLVLNVTVGKQSRDSGNRDTYIPVSLAYTPSNRLEVGALYVTRRGTNRTRHHEGAFAKYQLLADSRTLPAFAIAVTYRHDDDLEWLVNGALSHNFIVKGKTVVTGHAGVKWARSSADFDHRQDSSEYVGVEVPLASRLRLVGETSTRFRFEVAAASSIGLMWSAPNGANLGVGFVNLGRGVGRRLFVGVGYPLGGRRR